jgi:aspartyl-tRNA(Asn)/glutamyl-tRNA(Gln) amidotransferase subunit A
MTAADIASTIAPATRRRWRSRRPTSTGSAQSTPACHAFLYVDEDGALAAARRVDEAAQRGAALGPLAGVPLALKDVMATEGVPTTCGSRILEGWRPPYDATVTRRREAGVVVLGKTNMDEFAMGSSTEHSAYGPTHNPVGPHPHPGRQRRRVGRGGRGVRGAAGVGTDTGGSIRQPRSVTGTVGVKPTYGGVSRYGLSPSPARSTRPGRARAPSSTRRCCTRRSPATTRRLDVRSTRPVPPVVEAPGRHSVQGLRVAVVQELAGEGYEAGVGSAQ